MRRSARGAAVGAQCRAAGGVALWLWLFGLPLLGFRTRGLERWSTGGALQKEGADVAAESIESAMRDRLASITERMDKLKEEKARRKREKELRGN